MNTTPELAIFADSKPVKEYLSAIGMMAGFRIAGEKTGAKADLVLAASRPPPAGFDCPILWLEEGAEAGGQIRRMAMPVRAADLIDAMRRAYHLSKEVPEEIRIGDGTLDTVDCLWIRMGELPVRLTEKEVSILLHLHGASGVSVTREDLLHRVWAYASDAETHTLETHIYRLRQKIEKDPAAPAILLTDDAGYKIAF